MSLSDKEEIEEIDGIEESAEKPSSKKRSKKVLEVKRFQHNIKSGLLQSQVLERIAQNQVNHKEKSYSKSTIGIISSNLFTFFNLLCVVCVVALLYVNASIFNYAFAVTYIFNLVISIYQEIKAKKTIEKLSLMNAPTAHVIRSGKNVEIPVNEIVLDEIIEYSSGQQISVDGTVLSGSIEVNESLLTGESIPVKKNVGDKILAGSFAVSGDAICVADKVGEDRYIQKLTAKAKKFQKPSSELMRSLQWIIRIIGILIIPIGAGVFITNYNAVLSNNAAEFFTDGVLNKLGMQEIVSRTTSVIIGMIPAGMQLLTTIALSIGVVRLAKKNTSAQDMYSLEMLARVDVLCLDKTGTITDGRMKVSNCIEFDKNFKTPIYEIISSMQSALPDNNQTSIALKKYFGSEPKLIPTSIMPFSSARKYSAVSFSDGGKNLGTFALGAPEFVMKGREIPSDIQNQINFYTGLGQRVLMLAYSPEKDNCEELSGDLIPLAIITLLDNVRKDVIRTIAWFKSNGVNIKVISGDNPITVSEVAKRAGVEGAEKYISLDGLSNREVVNIADKYNVFGRVSPEQKAILIKALKAAGHTVAMTGDGVNDILAMKESDCSITVATGSAATKNIAHLVLLDNNFNSLPSVVAEGRRVINNIQRSASLYLMKTLFTTIFAILSIIRNKVFPFSNQMMIMLEVIVIGIGSFMLSMESNTNKVDGKFISYVFAYSIPGAIILIFNVLIMDILSGVTPPLMDPVKFKDTLMVAALTFGGLSYLYLICKPLNLYRSVLVISLTALSVAWIIFFMPAFQMYGILHNFNNNWPVIMVLVSLIQFDVTMGKFLTGITSKLRQNAYKEKIQ